METNFNRQSGDNGILNSTQFNNIDPIVTCPKCKRKFHKDNLPGHINYEIENSDQEQNINEIKLDEIITPHHSRTVGSIRSLNSNIIYNNRDIFIEMKKEFENVEIYENDIINKTHNLKSTYAQI